MTSSGSGGRPTRSVPHVFFFALICAFALAACSGTQGSAPLGATCDQFQATSSIEQSASRAVGSEVTVVLCSNPSTGFSWEEPQVGDATVISLVNHVYRAPDSASLPVVGAAGGEVITLRTLAAGTTTVSTRYSQPWTGGTKGEWTYKLTVTVH